MRRPETLSRDPRDKGLHDLIGELSTLSDEFRTRWASHNVRHHGAGTKNFHHDIVGDLTRITLGGAPAPASLPTSASSRSWLISPKKLRMSNSATKALPSMKPAPTASPTSGHGEQLLADARELERAGAFAVVLESVPADLGRWVSYAMRIPTA